MVGAILMVIGALLWLTGELINVFRRKGGTTSEFVWWVELRFPLARVLIGTFLVSLVGHLSPAHTPLLP